MQQSIASLQMLIEEEVSKYSKSLNGKPDELYLPLSYMLSLGGKRMRPLLVLLANDLFGAKPEKAINAALSIEVFHNFTLIHDDIMDNAPLRRNQETVYKKWNANIAILSGDTMMVKAYQLLATYDGPILGELLNLFNKTAIEVCEGQQMDMNFETQSTNIESYLSMIELKTAVLLAASLKIGAMVAGASEEDANNLYEFGRNIGIAFQLQDDILDAFGDPMKFGKQPGGDIISNKKTFLYLDALTKANAETKKELTLLFNTTDINPSEKIAQVLEIFQELNIKSSAQAEMLNFFEKGKSFLIKVSASEEKKSNLLKFTESLMVREI
jgi:geranylgeranyl diphosphate synthase, type II